MIHVRPLICCCCTVALCLVACGEGRVAPPAMATAQATQLTESPNPLTGKYGLLDMDCADEEVAPGDEASPQDREEIDCDASQAQFGRQYQSLIGMVEWHQMMREPGYKDLNDAAGQAADKDCDGGTALVGRPHPSCDDLDKQAHEAFAALQKTDAWQALSITKEWKTLKQLHKTLKVGNCR